VLHEALDAGILIESLYVTEGWTHPVVDRAIAANVAVFAVAPGVIERVADTVTPQPLLAIVSTPTVGVGALSGLLGLPEKEGPVFVMVGVDLRDPGNVGTLIRSAEASGATAVVLCDGCVEAVNPKTLRSSAGAVFHLPIVQGGSPIEVLNILRAHMVRCLATAVHGDAFDYSGDGVFSGRVAVVLGNEANGLGDDLSAHIDGWVTIPMAGRTESLNVGMTGSILAFEAARQRRIG
jgi:RNA methyltransferase, TrmH family